MDGWPAHSKQAEVLPTLSKDSCSSMGLMVYRLRPSICAFTISSWSLSRPPCHTTHHHFTAGAIMPGPNSCIIRDSHCMNNLNGTEGRQPLA